MTVKELELEIDKDERIPSHVTTWMDTEEMRPIDVESDPFRMLYAYGFCRRCVQACCSGINLLTLCYLKLINPRQKLL